MNVEQFLTEYPEFKLTNKSDTLKIINEFEKDKIFESEYFIKLKKYILLLCKPAIMANEEYRFIYFHAN